MTAFHATIETHTNTKQFTYDKCGRYEAFDEHGIPILKFGKECAISDTKQLAASKSIEGAIFAVLKNVVNQTGDATGPPIHMSVYQIPHKPDIDCSNTVYGDFSLTEEVRFEDPTTFPIESQKVGTYELLSTIAADVELTYLPQRYNKSAIIEKWGEAVKKGIKKFLQTNEYPVIENTYSVDAPDPDAYLEKPIM